MILDKHVTDFAKVRAALSLPLAPLQFVVSWPTQFIDKVNSIVTSHDTLLQENLRLKADQLLLKAQLQRLLAVESENDHLKALFQSSKQIKSKVLIAQIVAVDTEPFANQIVLDKGSQDNLYVGQPVLDANGVMGQVTQVGPLTSHVLLINDTHSGVPVQSVRNGVRAIAAGDGYSGKLKLLYIPHTTDIKIGDVFLTSGLGQLYPEGYPVGRVVSVQKDLRQPFASVLLQASAHFDSSREVLLIWHERKS